MAQHLSAPCETQIPRICGDDRKNLCVFGRLANVGPNQYSQLSRLKMLMKIVNRKLFITGNVQLGELHTEKAERRSSPDG